MTTTKVKNFPSTTARSSYTRWTDAEDLRLTAMVNDGSTMMDLMQAFGRSEGAIKSRLTRIVVSTGTATGCPSCGCKGH